MANKVPSDWRICATCSHWCGRTSSDFWCKWVEFDNTERARCAGGGFNGCPMQGMASCTHWDQRFK